MRYSSEHKAETHAKIVRTAANEFRAHGVDGVGVADLMNKVGLTHGGFYAHFKSRDALLAEALDAAFDDTLAQLGKAAAAAPPEERQQAIVNTYLGPVHRDRPDRGCAIAALGGEVSRLDAGLRDQFERRIEAMLALLNDNTSDPQQREASIRLLSTLVGALLMSRVVASEQLSNEILNAGKKAI